MSDTGKYFWAEEDPYQDDGSMVRYSSDWHDEDWFSLPTFDIPSKYIANIVYLAKRSSRVMSSLREIDEESFTVECRENIDFLQSIGIEPVEYHYGKLVFKKSQILEFGEKVRRAAQKLKEHYVLPNMVEN